MEAKERVVTPAGEFEAFKIKGRGQTYGSQSGVFREWAFYYAPVTKSIVKYYYDSGVGTESGKTDIELTKFAPAGS